MKRFHWWLFRLAVRLDKQSNHRDHNFCNLIDEFYVTTGLWK